MSVKIVKAFPFTVTCAVRTVEVLAVVGVAAGVLEVDPVLVLLPHALTTMSRTSPLTAKNERFGISILNVLLRKKEIGPSDEWHTGRLADATVSGSVGCSRSVVRRSLFRRPSSVSDEHQHDRRTRVQ